MTTGTLKALLDRVRTPSEPSPAITIAGDEASLTTPEGKTFRLPLDKLLALAAPAPIGTGGAVLPSCVRLAYSAGPLTAFVCEFSPEVRGLKWIAAGSPDPFGPGAHYRQVTIALPYVIVIALFQKGVLTSANEAFFRVKPLEDESDQLCYPALLNCSRYAPSEGRPLSWICTQYLDRTPIERERDPNRRYRAGIKALINCLFETGFNQSSDVHEYSSWFTESARVDPRIATIEAWERATREDPLFILDVPFLPVGLGVAQVVERIFTNHGIRRAGTLTSHDLARYIVNHGRS